jgi:anti-sigma B factor antagonist
MELKSELMANNVLVVHMYVDNLDAGNVREFKDAIVPLIGERNQVVLDMTSVKFVDSSGLGVLISCLRLANSRGGDFRLCALSATVLALFELMRMHRVFNIHNTCDEALRSFA